MRNTFTLLFAVFLFACQSDNQLQFPEGGYPYREKTTSSDSSFYFVPIKDAISTRDSFYAAFYGYHFHQSFDEPNLSLQPPDKPIFRFTYENSYVGYGAVLTMTEKEIILKEVKTGYPIPLRNQEMLNETEQNHYWFLWEHFPIPEYRQQNIKQKPWRVHYVDSITATSPKLLNPAYFLQLWDKTIDYGDEPFTYKQWQVPLTAKKFRHFVDIINNSGYWKMHPVTNNCPGEFTHPDGFSLEAIVPSKYHIVNYTQCYNDTTRFAKACDELIKYAKLDESMKQWHINDDKRKGIN